MNKRDSSREMHTICLCLLFYPRKPPGSVPLLQNIQSFLKQEIDADLHPKDVKKAWLLKESESKREDWAVRAVQLSKLAVGTTHPNTFIPDEHRMEQQTWSSGCNTGDIMPTTSSSAPSFSVCPFWLLCLHSLWLLPSLPFFWYFPPTQAVTLPPHHTALTDLHTVLPVTPTWQSHQLSCLMHLHVTTVREGWNLISCSPHSEEHSSWFLIPEEDREWWSNFTSK